MSQYLPAPTAPAPDLGPPLRRAAPRPPSDGPAIEWGRYLSAVRRHLWLILLVTGIGSAGAVFMARGVQPEYVAQATIWIEGSDRTSAERGPIRSGELLRSYAWIELLKSYEVLDHVVTEQRMYVYPLGHGAEALATLQATPRLRPGHYRVAASENGTELRLSTAEDVELARVRTGQPIGAALGVEWTPPAGAIVPGKPVEFVLRNPRDVARELGESVQAQMAENGTFLRISLGGSNPERIAAVLGALSERYVDVAAELKSARLVNLTEILEEQRRTAEASLAAAEHDLERFRTGTVALPGGIVGAAPGGAGAGGPIFERVFGFRVEREQLEQERAAISRVAVGGRASPAAIDALAALPSVRSSPELSQVLTEHTAARAELRALEQRYTGEHLPVQRLQAQLQRLEESVIPRLAGDLAARLDARDAELDRRIAQGGGELRQIPSREIEGARLQRRVEVAADLYTMLRQRHDEARLAAASVQPDLRVLDQAAVPSTPLGDRRSFLMVVGVLGSLGMSICGAILLDRVDRRVRYPQQVTEGLGLPILGALPHLGAGKGRRAEELAAAAQEGLRELRLRVLAAAGPGRPLCVTISSPQSGDGKSTVASRLARSFAAQSYRTLLIDGDIRRGELHHALGVRRTPGLTDLLAGKAGLAEVLQPTSEHSLTLISSGTRMQYGPELLGSGKMERLLRHLGSHFDIVLIDSPPLGGAVDPYILASASRNLLLVLRTGHTDRALADAKLEVLDRLPVSILGTVLNDVPRTSVYRHYGYLPGYGAEDEVPDAAVPLRIG